MAIAANDLCVVQHNDRLGFIMEEKQTIVELGTGTVTKRGYGDGRIERCDTVKDVSRYIERIEEMIERKRVLSGD